MTELNNQYIAFARKYRPTNFAELHGQEVLSKILHYEILNNRLAQSYLLTGIRGVGKTTSARIIAKTINCTNLIAFNANIKPCEQCQNCHSFNNDNHPDIIEMDAASRTGVDDIRQIIENSEYRPLIGKYKVFIIDEVHMLSKGAFNALLKTLEEPPLHVIFIFATTEVHKIPLTVISRCQRYDLKRLTFDEILQLIKQIAEKEALKFDLKALKVIAYKSDGSARDAIAMLDHATNLRKQESNNIITEQMINQMLGLVDTTVVIKFLQYIFDKNVAESIALVNHLYMSSTNLEIFIGLVTDFIAHLNKVKMLPSYSSSIYGLFDDEIIDILTKTNFSNLSILWQIYSKAIQEIKTSHNQLIETEMLVMKSIYCQTLPSIEELMNIVNDGIQVDATQSLSLTANYTITDFLKYLYLYNEMEIYYLLLNQVEVTSFSNNIIKLAGSNLNIQIKEQISNLLFAWTKEKWTIVITEQLKIITLKDQLINKVKSSKDWAMLTSHFPDITISDILLKT